jgi:hypothetical protein
LAGPAESTKGEESMSSERDEFGETTMEWFEASDRKDKVAQVTMSTSAAKWFTCMVDHGLFVVDPMGRTSITPGARPLFEALNAVLAGGKVEVRIEDPGQAQSRARMDTRLKEIV